MSDAADTPNNLLLDTLPNDLFELMLLHLDCRTSLKFEEVSSRYKNKYASKPWDPFWIRRYTELSGDQPLSPCDQWLNIAWKLQDMFDNPDDKIRNNSIYHTESINSSKRITKLLINQNASNFKLDYGLMFIEDYMKDPDKHRDLIKKILLGVNFDLNDVPNLIEIINAITDQDDKELIDSFLARFSDNGKKYWTSHIEAHTNNSKVQKYRITSFSINI